MSADRQRLVSAIRRIATTDPEIRSLLDAAQSRGSQPASTGVGASDSERDRQCCDGSVGRNINPGVNQRDPDADGQDSGLDSSDPAKLSMGEGSLTGVTDCATGEDICFDGDDWLPPDGWESATDPPIDPTFDDDIYGKTNLDGVIEIHRTCNQALSAAKNYFGDCYAGPDCSDLSVGVKYNAGFSDSAPCNDTGEPLSGAWELLSCTDDFDPVCDDPAPALEAWPEDGCVNLVIKRGTLVGSKFDPENDGSYSDPKSEIQLCDGAGNQIKLSPSADGGWKTIDAINPGDGYLYDSQGNQIARISDDEYSDPKV